MSEILNLIHQITANRDSGRLEILAGAIQGELSFSDGKLVDARVGHLTGFRAVNAAVAMRDARFSFDSSFAPLAASSITASERVVLKQFFGIETAATGEYFEPVVEQPVPVTVPDAADEITIVRSNVQAPPPPLPPRPRFSYRSAVVFAALASALVTAAALVMYKFNRSGSPAVVARVESPLSPAPVESSSSPVSVESSSRPAPVEEPQPARDVSARNLSGKWNIVNTVETTSYSNYKNMKIGFHLSLNQTGTTFTGNGAKISENGRSLPAGSRTPIQVQGSIKGDRIEATFSEAGTARKSNGKFVWRVDKAGRGLTGNFATTAARSSGKSAATREM